MNKAEIIHYNLKNYRIKRLYFFRFSKRFHISSEFAIISKIKSKNKKVKKLSQKLYFFRTKNKQNKQNKQKIGGRILPLSPPGYTHVLFQYLFLLADNVFIYSVDQINVKKTNKIIA